MIIHFKNVSALREYIIIIANFREVSPFGSVARRNSSFNNRSCILYIYQYDDMRLRFEYCSRIFWKVYKNRDLWWSPCIEGCNIYTHVYQNHSD